jgi:poly(hydroxyalkanoate) granule-associated protein
MARTKRTTRTPRAAKRTLNTLAARARGVFENTRTIALESAQAARDAAIERAGEARTRTVQAVTQLERAFEQRVSKAVRKLGVPSAAEVRALSRQVSELQASVERLRRSRARA